MPKNILQVGQDTFQLATSGGYAIWDNSFENQPGKSLSTCDILDGTNSLKTDWADPAGPFVIGGVINKSDVINNLSYVTTDEDAGYVAMVMKGLQQVDEGVEPPVVNGIYIYLVINAVPADATITGINNPKRDDRC